MGDDERFFFVGWSEIFVCYRMRCMNILSADLDCINADSVIYREDCDVITSFGTCVYHKKT